MTEKFLPRRFWHVEELTQAQVKAEIFRHSKSIQNAPHLVLLTLTRADPMLSEVVGTVLNKSELEAFRRARNLTI
jgi:hypothetical protein